MAASAYSGTESLDDWLDVTFRFYTPLDALSAHGLLFSKAASLPGNTATRDARLCF